MADERHPGKERPLMSSPDGVLAAIDSALRDYSVSPDAMRSAPDEPVSADTPRPGAAQLWGVDINGTHLYRTSTQPWTFFRVQGEAPHEPIRPEDLCPSCGRCRWERRSQSIHNEQPVGPLRIAYMCGYEEQRWPERSATPEENR